MESIKNALGYGSQSGQEPISGEIGKGTADQPYDAGNVAGQSGSSAAEVTSTNPTGTTQYDTAETTNNGTVQNETQDTKTNTSETLAAGVTSGGTADLEGPGSDSNTNAQDAFFNKADITQDKPAEPPKIPDPITNKDPFTSTSGAASSNEKSTESNDTPSTNNNEPTNSSTLEKVGSSAPEKGYLTADTQPHSQSSEVLSSATPGAAIDGPHKPGGDNNTSATQPPSSGDTTATNIDNTTTTSATDSGNTSTAPPATTAAALDTDYPSPRTQPSEAQGGLSGISHNTGNAPSAPETGSDAVEDPALGASQGHGKKKMSERIKEKLHLGKKSHE
ncbi:MAG: hypothetical protein L6R41_005680 [Letrouitia leprolyta]|nr:MAG: hypothetical protein L6R41_005680 [Letrouitia leprolyta]